MLPEVRRSPENPDPDEGEVTREGAGSHSLRHRADLCGVGGREGVAVGGPRHSVGSASASVGADREAVVQAGDAQQLQDLGGERPGGR